MKQNFAKTEVDGTKLGWNVAGWNKTWLKRRWMKQNLDQTQVDETKLDWNVGEWNKTLLKRRSMKRHTTWMNKGGWRGTPLGWTQVDAEAHHLDGCRCMQRHTTWMKTRWMKKNSVETQVDETEHNTKLGSNATG
jgi:hypothetical protein